LSFPVTSKPLAFHEVRSEFSPTYADAKLEAV
jgi:hypothetical protein